MTADPMQILFVGETWKGSSARSLREAHEQLPGVAIDEVCEDHYSPKGSSLVVRSAVRLLRPWHRAELQRAIGAKIAADRPQVLLVYKGSGVSADVVRRAKQMGVLTVNVFPDCSPHAYGPRLQRAMGEYDLVISTKPFHPEGWKSIYSYHNRCLFVPHGYDPAVHYRATAPDSAQQKFDLTMVANWRPQYHGLMLELASRIAGKGLRVAIAGAGWSSHAQDLPRDWQLADAVRGRAYGEFARQGRIAIAPVHREVVINGRRQPGDEDSTRTYELAALQCFFVHRRTPFARTVYDEQREVPMWDDVAELAGLIDRYLPEPVARAEMAARAHARAVPAYSIPSRAEQVLKLIEAEMSAAGVARERRASAVR